MIPNMTLHLLRAIYRGQHTGYLTLTAIHPSKRLPTPSRHIPITDRMAVHQALADLLAANAQGWGAYFSLALRKRPLERWKRGGQSDLLVLPALFADLDGNLSISFERIQQAGLAGMPAPSAMVGSGRGLHLYWFITPTTDFHTANLVLAGLAQRLGGDVTTAANALRLPGSRNTKPEVNRPCQLLWLAEQRRYILADFKAFQVETPPRPPTELPMCWRAPPTLSDELNPTLVEAVVHSLLRDYAGFVQKNGWIGALCPCGHSRDQPGRHFGFSPQHGVARCFGRHGQILLKELCTLIGVDPAYNGGLYRKSI
ncbi:MAG: hypothetical protein K8I82_13600 [Anaerolineae bacterium]|nr:hypothetical protein [Anaerolineae bacterium]